MNLLKKNGCKFKARIDGKWCEGVIYVDGRTVYLMQNGRDGSKPCPFPSELGFSCSWNVNQGTEEDLECNDVEDFEIIENSPIIALSSNERKRNLLLFIL